MWTQFIFTIFGMFIGIIFTCLFFLRWDSDEEKLKKEIILNQHGTDSWCEKNCKCHEFYFSNYKDPDDAWKELDSNCCSKNCPLIEAQLLLYREEYRR